MPPITNLQDLLVHQLRDVYSAEKQLVAALPKMARKTTSEELEAAITSHLEETTEQVRRLEQVFEMLGISNRGPKCKAMEGLIEEAKEMLEEDIEPNVLDAGIIASSQRVEHYEIAAYGTVIEFARALGHDEIVQLLQQTLDEEKTCNEMLTTLATGGINALAQDSDMSADGEGDEDAEDDEGDEHSSQQSSKKTPARAAGARKAAKTNSTSKAASPTARAGARQR